MPLVDITLANKTVKYNGMTYPLPLSNMDTRKFIENLDYWYPRHPEFQEQHREYERTDIPNQAFSFYLFVAMKRRIPNLSEYCQYYFKEYCQQIDNTYFMFKQKYWTGMLEHGLGVATENKFPITACMGRLARAYTTFLREIELYTRLQDAGCRVQYSFVDDKRGIDLKIFGKSYTYCVKEFVATKKSLEKLDEKETGKAEKWGQKNIYLPLYMSDIYAPANIEVINDIYLYDAKTSEYLIKLASE